MVWFTTFTKIDCRWSQVEGMHAVYPCLTKSHRRTHCGVTVICQIKVYCDPTANKILSHIPVELSPQNIPVILILPIGPSFKVNFALLH